MNQIIQDMNGAILYVGSASVVEVLGKDYEKHKYVRIINVYRESGSLNFRDAVWKLPRSVRAGMLMRVKRKPTCIQIPLSDEVCSMLEKILKIEE